MIYNQAEFDIRCEWGLQGVSQLAPISDVIIIVDILSFSTSVEIATNNGAIIYPYRWRDDSAVEYAKSVQQNYQEVVYLKKGIHFLPHR
jgi:2-phosphosulfolactate phosphatase